MNSERRLKILLITKWYPNRNDPQFGVFIRKQAVAAAAFVDLTIFYAQSDEHVSAGEIETIIQTADGITEYRVYFSRNKSIIAPLVHALRYFSAWNKTWKNIRRDKGMPDVVQAYILLRPAIIAWWLKFRNGIPFIVSEQWSGYATGKFLERPFWIRFLSKHFVRKSSGVTAVSEFLKKKMESCGLGDEIVVIPNVIEMQPKPSENSAHTGNKIRILIVADLVDEIKNISGAIRAISGLTNKFPSMECRIIGHGPDETFLKNLARELGALDKFIFFEGLKTNEEVYRYLWNTDFLVMNSNYETFSLICAEAMSCGKPVIATRCGGPEEFVNDENGIQVKPGDTRELTEALTKMIAGYKNYSPEKIRAYVSERFGKEQTGSKFFSVYKKAIGQSQ